MKFYYHFLLVLVIFLVILLLSFFELKFNSDVLITWKLSNKKQDTDLIILKQVCIVTYLIAASIHYLKSYGFKKALVESDQDLARCCQLWNFGLRC